MSGAKLTFHFLLFDGFSNLVLASALEPLRAARDLATGPDITWQLTSPDRNPVLSSSDIRIQPDNPASAPGRVDYLVLVGGYGIRDHVTPENLALLHRLRDRADTIIGLDTAPWLMAAAGWLHGRRATLHWQEFDAFQEAFPETVLSRERHVHDGVFITTGGASTVLDMIIDLLRNRAGAATAFDVASMFLYDAEQQAADGRGPARLGHAGSAELQAVVQVMTAHIEHPLPLPEIATQAGLSLRSLTRVFSRDLTISPGRYYRILRLGRARALAQDTRLSVSDIALRTGFSSAAVLARAFSAYYGISIRDVRQNKR